jgi:hypothetical protein
MSCSVPVSFLLVFAAAVASTACTEESPVETGDTSIGGVECGEPSTYDVEVTAKVVDSSGTGVSAIEVVLDDRGWTYGELGGGTTGIDGSVTFTATGVTSLPNCWGTVLNYWIVATDPADSSRTVEDDMNTELYNAIDGGSMAADVSDFPLVLP